MLTAAHALLSVPFVQFLITISVAATVVVACIERKGQR